MNNIYTKMKLCGCGCGTEIPLFIGVTREHKSRPRKYVLGHQPRPSRKGKLSPFWEGGKYINSRGYVMIWNPNHPNTNGGGYVCEHKLLISKLIGRPIAKNEVVHHKNGIKTDNRIENLQLMTRSEHARIHIKSRRYCPHCGKSLYSE